MEKSLKAGVLLVSMLIAHPAFSGELVPSPEQQDLYKHGLMTVTSRLQRSTVSVALKGTEKDQAIFYVEMTNHTDENVNFLISSVSVTDKRGKELVVMSASDVQEEINKQERSRRLGLALQGFGAGVSGDAGQMNRFDRNLSTFEQEMEQIREQTRNNVLANHTLFSSEEYVGDLVVDKIKRKSRKAGYSITIEFADESHVFEVTGE